MKSQAVIELYSNAKKIVIDSDENITAYDANNETITLNLASIAEKEAELRASNELDKLRAERDRLLAETDYWMFSDTDTVTQAQLDYRQALRDITDSATSLDDVTWPTKP